MENQEEKKGIRISYSAIDTYNKCSERYRIEYIEKPELGTIPTPFVIGNIIDTITGYICDSLKKESKEVVTKEQTLNLLREKFLWYPKEKDKPESLIYVPTSDEINFTNSDVDGSLLLESDVGPIKQFANECGVLLKSDLDDINAFIELCKGMVKAEQLTLNSGQYKLYKQISYLAVLRKLEIMTEYVYDWIVNNIDYVVETQRKIEETDEDGNTYIGYDDLEAVLKGEDFIRTMDFKTSSNPKAYYSDDCVEDSLQLHLYANWTNLDVGYVVINKNIPKKLDTRQRTMIRYVSGRVTEEGINDALDYMNETIQGIKSERFIKNPKACKDFGGCPWRDKCWSEE